jgi:hypothetical protein
VALISRNVKAGISGPLVYILRPNVPFQFLLWLLRIEKPTRAKVSDHEQQTNGDSQKHVADHLFANRVAASLVPNFRYLAPLTFRAVR